MQLGHSEMRFYRWRRQKIVNVIFWMRTATNHFIEHFPPIQNDSSDKKNAPCRCIDFIHYAWACAFHISRRHFSSFYFFSSLPTAVSLNHFSLLFYGRWYFGGSETQRERNEISSVIFQYIYSTSAVRHHWMRLPRMVSPALCQINAIISQFSGLYATREIYSIWPRTFMEMKKGYQVIRRQCFFGTICG